MNNYTHNPAIPIAMQGLIYYQLNREEVPSLWWMTTHGVGTYPHGVVDISLSRSYTLGLRFTWECSVHKRHYYFTDKWVKPHKSSIHISVLSTVINEVAEQYGYIVDETMLQNSQSAAREFEDTIMRFYDKLLEFLENFFYLVRQSYPLYYHRGALWTNVVSWIQTYGDFFNPIWHRAIKQAPTPKDKDRVSQIIDKIMEKVNEI